MIDVDAWFHLIRHDEQPERAMHAFKEALALVWEERGKAYAAYEEAAFHHWHGPFPAEPTNPYEKGERSHEDH